MRNATPGRAAFQGVIIVSGQENDIAADPELQALANQIIEERGGYFRRSAEHVVRMGELLDEVRKKIAHGGWLTWIETNCSIGKSTARNYINLSGAVKRGEIDLPTVRSLSLKAALKLIAKPKEPPKQLTDTKDKREPSRRRENQVETKPEPSTTSEQPVEPLYVPPAPPIELMPGGATGTTPSLKQLSEFEDAADYVINILKLAAKVKVLQIHTQRAAELLDEIDEALVAFNSFRDQIAGIAVGGVIDGGAA
jgi:hypothetical protein